jgi:hypothetical protein
MYKDDCIARTLNILQSDISSEMKIDTAILLLKSHLGLIDRSTAIGALEEYIKLKQGMKDDKYCR